jgi:hypothetical protein
MNYAARIVWNIDNWEYPSGLTDHGISVSHKNGDYHYGLEEWLNNKRLRELKLGYLDSYRITNRKEASSDILLYTIDPEKNHYYHVGLLYGVSQLDPIDPNLITSVKNKLSLDWLVDPIEQDFRRIEKTPAGQNSKGKEIYRQNNWNSKKIISEPPGGFIVNIRYDNLELFNRSKWVNLTAKDPEISKRWRFIRHRYEMPNQAFNRALSQYLEGQFS